MARTMCKTVVAVTHDAAFAAADRRIGIVDGQAGWGGPLGNQWLGTIRATMPLLVAISTKAGPV
jgi:hypothetical protein